VKSSQQRTRFTVTDHSSRVQTGTPFMAFQPSAKSDWKRPLSNELHGKNRQTPRKKPTQLTEHGCHTQAQTARSGFKLQTNAKFEHRNPLESDEGGKKNRTHLAKAVPFLHSKERLHSRTHTSQFVECAEQSWVDNSKQDFRNAHNYRSQGRQKF
jgi:hypothetical protein